MSAPAQTNPPLAVTAFYKLAFIICNHLSV